MPMLSGSGPALHKRSSDRTDFAPMPSISYEMKEKIRKKWTLYNSTDPDHWFRNSGNGCIIKDRENWIVDSRLLLD